MEYLNKITSNFFVETFIYLNENNLSKTEYLLGIKELINNSFKLFNQINSNSININLKTSLSLINERISFNMN